MFRTAAPAPVPQPHANGPYPCSCKKVWDHDFGDVYWQERVCPRCFVTWTGNPVARDRQGSLCSTCSRNRF